MLADSIYWIGLSIFAVFGCLFLLWLSYRLFARVNIEDGADARIKTALREMSKLESSLKNSGQVNTAGKEFMPYIIENAEMESSINGTRWNNVKNRFKKIEDRLDAIEMKLEKRGE